MEVGAAYYIIIEYKEIPPGTVVAPGAFLILEGFCDLSDDFDCCIGQLVREICHGSDQTGFGLLGASQDTAKHFGNPLFIGLFTEGFAYSGFEPDAVNSVGIAHSGNDFRFRYSFSVLDV